MDFLKLERVELGGSRGKILTEMVYRMNDEFHDSWRILRESKYDPLDYSNEVLYCAHVLRRTLPQQHADCQHKERHNNMKELRI